MVYTEINLILDCGTKKSVPEIYMTKEGLKLFNRYQLEELDMLEIRHQLEFVKMKIDEFNEKLANWQAQYEMVKRSCVGMPPPYDEPMPGLDVRLGMKPQPPNLESYGIERDKYEKYKNFQFIGKKYESGMDTFLYHYYNIKPFEPWVMLNVSPDRAGTKITKADICKFKRAFKSYMKEEWYEKWYITFETGGNGDHLHFHAVCKMGSDNKNIKSVRTHIGKGNWKRQFMKHSKAEGFEGVKNQGCQAIIINKEELLKDKLNYLIEEKKPIGHKNKTPKTLEGDWVINKRESGSLLTLLSRETS